MKRRYLSVISAILTLVTVLSCFMGCSIDTNGDATGESSDIATELSDIITEKATEKSTKKTTKKTTKKETDPIPGKSTTNVNLVASEIDLSKKSKSFRLVGRTKYVEDGIGFDHCASVVEFQGYMTGDLTISAWSSGDTYLTVYIDGERITPTSMGSGRDKFKINGEKTITLTTFTGKYFHTVRIVKQGETSQCYATLKKLSITGYLLDAPEEREHYIEFFGDSLTVGYSNIANGGESSQGAAKLQDTTQAYAYLAAEMLNADCSILARSGTGLARGYTNDYNNNIWKYFSKDSYRRHDVAFDFSTARVPDLIVIHLGANDYANDASKDKFVSKGKELVDTLKKGYGKAIPLIWAYDPGEQVNTSWMKEIVDYYKNTYGGQTYMISLEWRSKGKVNGHPNVAGHQKNANEIVNLIKTNNILK